METHNKIRQLRDIKGYSQEYIASQLGISQNTYSRIENGQVGLKMDRLQEIARILGTEVSQIMKFDENLVFKKEQRFERNKNRDSTVAEVLVYKEYIRHLENEINFLRNLLAAAKKL